MLTREMLCMEMGNYYVANNKNNKMKESTKTRFPITFTRTEVVEFSYDILAESQVDAEKLIADGCVCPTKEYTVSVTTVKKV